MSLFERDEWKLWAQAWGLTHQPQRGKLIRNEAIAGSYKGYLLRVGWGGDYGKNLVVLVRFPKLSQDLKALREQLLRMPDLSSLPGWKGRAAAVNVRLEPSTLLWQYPFSFRRPKTEEIQGWVDRLLQRLPEVIKPFSGQCEECGTSGVQRYVLLEGVPAYLCASCQQRLASEGDMAHRRYEQKEANYPLGVLYGAAGAAIGGVVWAFLVISTKHIYAIVAIGISALASFAYAKGAGKIDAAGRGIAALLTMAGVAFGDILCYAYAVHAAHPEVPFRIDIGWRIFLRVLTASPGELAGEIIFGLVGVGYVFSYLKKPKLKPKIEQAK